MSQIQAMLDPPFFGYKLLQGFDEGIRATQRFTDLGLLGYRRWDW